MKSEKPITDQEIRGRLRDIRQRLEEIEGDEWYYVRMPWWWLLLLMALALMGSCKAHGQAFQRGEDKWVMVANVTPDYACITNIFSELPPPSSISGLVSLAATVRYAVATNWETVSVTRPVQGDLGSVVNAVYVAPIYNQVGTVTTNKVLTFDYDGKKHEAVVGSSAGPVLARSISEMDLVMEGGK